jgi:hypothetical protein
VAPASKKRLSAKLALHVLGVPEESILVAQSNLAITYEKLGRHEAVLRLRIDVHSGLLKLNGEENLKTLMAANNYAASLIKLERFEEAKSLLRKTTPVARRVRGESSEVTLNMRWNHAKALYCDPAATLDDLRDAVTTLEEIEPTVRRVFGGANPTTEAIERSLRNSRAELRARETPDDA